MKLTLAESRAVLRHVAAKVPGYPRGTKFGRAKRTVVDDITFDSKAEAKWYAILKPAPFSGPLLFCHVRFPLYILCPDAKGQPLYFRPDFVIAEAHELKRVVEVKPSARAVRSRDYELRKRAFEVTYRVKVEEVE